MCQILVSNRAGEELRGWQVTRTKGCSVDKEGSRGGLLPSIHSSRRSPQRWDSGEKPGWAEAFHC